MSMRAPDAYAKYEEDWRDPEIVAAMALIDRLDNIGGQLQRLNENLEREHR